ncbi:hypothetical protein, partial [Ancrocorticia populi]
EVLDGMADNAQRKWAAWRRKQHLDATTPEHFQNLLDSCSAFADPVLRREVDGFHWSSHDHRWS